VLAKGDPGGGEAGGPPADSITGKLKSNGAAGSGKLRLDVSITTVAAAGVIVDHYKWDGAQWQFSHQDSFNIGSPITMAISLDFTGTPGVTYYSYMRIVRGTPPAIVAHSNSNTLQAP
jgi:hypothetical protein